MEYGLGYREVIPDHNFEDAWEEIILSTGGSQSTLQDIKVPERAGGYSYKNSYDTATRNRFIYWKITHDVLELSEHSLDINLANNRVKYKFTDTPILDGITIHETDNLIVILVATVSSVHKLSFPHPVSLQKQVSLVYTDITVSSIFSEASIKNASDPHTFYVVPTAGLTNAPIAHAAASWLVMPQEEALFAFAFNSGTILLLRLDTITGLVHQSELKIESIVPRFLNGIATALRGKTFENEVFMSIVMHAFGNEVYLFTFCKEGHLRMWSCDKAQCVAVINVFTNNQSSNEIIQHHNLRKITNSNDALYLCTYIKLAARCEFSIFKLIQDSAYAFIRVCTLLTPKLSDFDFQLELHGRLENIEDFQHSITILLKILTYNLDPLNEIGDVKNTPKTHKLYSTVNHFFGSQLGLSVISKIMTQIISMRFAVCRNLLILQRIAMDKQKLFDSRSVNNIKSSLVTRSIVLTQAYYVLMWICESNASVTPSQALLETNIHRIALLTTIKNQTNIGQRHNRTFSLLEMFIQYGTKQYIYKLVDQIIHNSSNFHVWHFGLFNYTNFILQLIWPISENFLFPEWLLANCQFLVIQEYVRLLNGWCALNSASRKFILAISLLEMGESYKASDNFLRASNGVMTDSYMSNLFQMENFSKSKTIVKYYLKVIELFEQHNAQDIIIELAITAITVANKDDSNLPTLHSIVFTQHLNLEHHIEAYNCLNINPDGARRIDCLRQLIVVLFNRKKLKDLISFPYIDMYQDLEKIMETRARSIDLMENNYYNFLYSFHINKGNMRKAASVMYEQAMRLSQEPYSWSTISQQVHCLLACINVLRLVHKKFRWIVRPVIDHSSIDDYPNKRKKRNSNGHEILQCNYSKRIEVLELEDIKREYALASSKLKLTKIGLKANNISSAGPSEIAAILSNYGLHVDAVDICRYFKLSIISILENLVSHCTRLDPKDQFKTYSWLDEIPVVGYNLLTSSSMNISWKLLQYFILQYEEIGNSELHKAVTKQLLYHEIFLPEWLYSSYAKKNAPEFLRLLIQMGRLDEAAYFSIKYIQAILGKGKAYFGLESSLSVTTFSTFFPFNYIEILLLELEYASRTENSYIMVREQLKNEYDIYLKSVKHISMNMVLMKKNA
ncbi:nuclear pore complex protein Nup160 homolog isoform X4 [Phymastichus coffea]|uniref:nuclear pore complex protein Nup160 homolog isoform X4 n=1 Tax=Phymastichus coffea TaxID=108790 RepID=UPI00273BBBDA|nr:nuclear pore complex protein Nup160 homolog isoform X4 [Phymastichus coffea]